MKEVFFFFEMIYLSLSFLFTFSLKGYLILLFIFILLKTPILKMLVLISLSVKNIFYIFLYSILTIFSLLILSFGVLNSIFYLFVVSKRKLFKQKIDKEDPLFLTINKIKKACSVPDFKKLFKMEKITVFTIIKRLGDIIKNQYIESYQKEQGFYSSLFLTIPVYIMIIFSVFNAPLKQYISENINTQDYIEKTLNGKCLPDKDYKFPESCNIKAI